MYKCILLLYTTFLFCMKYLFALLLIVATTTTAQKTLPPQKDSAQQKLMIKNDVTVKKTAPPLSITAQIEKELTTILTAYTSQPNTAATWVQVKAAAENVLLTHFLNGKLQGTKAGQAFYVTMGSETMTAADIANKKMILIAGIATIKPAEFTVIRIEKKCVL